MHGRWGRDDVPLGLRESIHPPLTRRETQHTGNSGTQGTACGRPRAQGLLCCPVHRATRCREGLLWASFLAAPPVSPPGSGQHAALQWPGRQLAPVPATHLFTCPWESQLHLTPTWSEAICPLARVRLLLDVEVQPSSLSQGTAALEGENHITETADCTGRPLGQLGALSQEWTVCVAPTCGGHMAGTAGCLPRRRDVPHSGLAGSMAPSGWAEGTASSWPGPL